MSKQIAVGRSPLGAPVTLSLMDGFLCLVQGFSKAGKTILANNILLELIKTWGPELQIAIADPKKVGYMAFRPRCHVYPEETQWLPLLDALNNEMLRRYDHMASNGLSEYPITETDSFILLVLDEMAAITQNQRLLKKERDQFASLLTAYANQCRQAAMGLMILCQSCDSSVMPTVVRSNCSTRFAMRTAGAEQVKMISGGREEECPCDLLTRPGEFFALTSDTNGKWVRGRTWYTDSATEHALIERYAADKRTPYCLDWNNPEFTG